MTGDVEEECSLLRISHQLGEPVSSDTCTVTQADSAAYINSNMTIEDTCMYTTAIPAEISGDFPEGTVLQVLPDATVVALAIKDLPTTSESTIIFKDSNFISENTTFQNAMNNLLAVSSENGETQPIDVPVCAEENISDIDLSFLNETEVAGAISDAKCMNETTVKELQGMIADASSQPSSLLQNNLNISDDIQKPSPEGEEANPEMAKDSDGQPGDVVMIDVSKPIQLSQNSLIMVNGQKCILQHDTSNGQVIAYPVKEQEKPRRRRGRPRKASVEQQAPTESEPIENSPVQETESLSEEEREQGLLEIVNDDGSLIRRSSRKRKRNKVLRDYETGNLQQELGSDVDDGEIVDIEAELYTRKKKAKGPGRPRKYPKPLEVPSENISNNDIKRPRGRPRKHVPEIMNEPTQAFLIQTADGQTLMMQVPMSSIPAGCSLQEVAEQIAKKLNEGLNQANNASPIEIKDATTKQPDSGTLEETIENITSQESVSETVVQDHSIGSTTNFSSVQQQLCAMDENSERVVDSSCQDIMNNIDNIMNNVDEVGETLENENCAKDVTSSLQNSISGNILNNQNNLNSLNVPQCSDDSFCINMPSTSSLEQSPILCSIAENLSDQFCVMKQNVEETLTENFEQVQTNESAKVSSELLEKYNILRNKIDFHLLSQNGDDSISETQNLQIQQVMKNVNTSNIPGPILKVNDLKLGIASKLIESLSNGTDVVDQIFNIDNSEQSKNIVYESTDLNNIGSNCLQSSTTIKSSNVIQGVFLDTTEINSADDKSSLLTKTDLSTDNQTLDTILPLQEFPSSTENSAVTSTSTATVIPIAERVLPTILPAPPATGPKNCKICTTPYKTDEEIIQHFKARHPKCICSECDYMAERPYVIKRHFYRHSNQPCVCKLCDKKYKDHYILKMHIKMVHLPTAVWYTCDICEKQFNRKAHLKRHLRIHAPVKQFQCPHCEYKGCEKSDITKHLLIHQDPKFTCNICGKAFRHIKNMDLHMKRHSGKKDYKCGICDFFGYTFTDIRKHIERRHSNAACPDCGGVFQGVGDLKEHKKSGECQPLTAEDIKVEEASDIPEDGKVTVLDEMTLPDLLEGDQTHITTVGEFSEEALSALQNGHFIMTSVEGLLGNQNCQFIMEGLEESNIVNPEGLSVISVDKDSNQVITLVTSDGRNLSLPFKNCLLPSECDTSTDQNENISEKFVITSDTEVASCGT